MSGDLLPVLWLCGPPGVGKTTVGWEIYRELGRAGAGYVDVDQLGMCFPEPAADPGRYLMQARNVGAVVDTFRAAGARCVVVSGVVDTAHGVHADRIPGAALTVCRLRVGHDELTRRFLGRTGSTVVMADALRDAEAMDASDVAGVCVETSGLSVPEVARRVRERAGGWPVLAAPEHPSLAGEVPAPVPGEGSVLWLCGATGVGKSTVGFTLFQRALRAGHMAAYLDLDQIGFCAPAPADDPGNHRVKARNLAAVWQTYRAAGARCLTVVGQAEDESAIRTYTDALAPATVTLCRLHAGREQLTRRILSRRDGGSWAQPGDPLKGRPTARLLQVADAATADAEALDRAALGDLRVDTDGCTVEEVAEAVAAAAVRLRSSSSFWSSNQGCTRRC
ncbi:hypothetical protein [Streptomyces sp. ME19-01-6]|uniref:hypothetical protein n=1 Tax=Streptomyces sp. ME19-01-6 TaxID=3028686 RepID=UPI0029A781B4|nr:hypothetical protein [Streptomyces sp. ME19-01-6]MDX3225616.1 hypothetical protein [Streptomyces sp. ME19-01-6]